MNTCAEKGRTIHDDLGHRSSLAGNREPAREASSGLTRARAIARGVLAAIYLVAGVFHLYTPDALLLITPDWVPFPRQIILGTGLCEIAGAVALLTRKLRRAAGLALALYAVCVFPANIKHFVDSLSAAGWPLGLWYHLPRLAFQPVFVWWALFAGEVVSWPFRTAPRR